MLKEKIVEDLKIAMKSGQEFEVGIFRFILSAFHNKEIEKKGKGGEPILSDDEVIEVLTREVKKRKEAIEIYNGGGRNDLAEKEARELVVIKKYLPEQLSEAEIEKVVRAAIVKTGAKETKDFGKVMAEAMKELKGRADAREVNQIIKNTLVASTNNNA